MTLDEAVAIAAKIRELGRVAGHRVGSDGHDEATYRRMRMALESAGEAMHVAIGCMVVAGVRDQ